MILIADSGSTRTDWRLISPEFETVNVETQGLNPYFVSFEEIILAITTEFEPLNVFEEIQEIYFYGAGCGSPESQREIKTALLSIFTEAKVEVYTDILGAARALFGNTSGIAGILGTGSNVCFYNGKEIAQSVLSLGYLLGDEGSGTYIGKLFLKKYLHAQLPQEIMIDFEDTYTITRQELVRKIYQNSFPNRYIASFVPFIKHHLYDKNIYDIIHSSFHDFVNQQLKKINGYETYPIGIVGSVAYYFKPVLQTVFNEHGITISNILDIPVNGLLSYHRNKK